MGIIRNRCDKQIFSAQSVLMFNIKWLLKELTGCRDRQGTPRAMRKKSFLCAVIGAGFLD